MDALVNNAAHSIRRPILEALDRIHDYERTMQLNYIGAVRMTMGLIPRFLAQGRGQVVNASTLSAQVPIPLFSAYLASKAALDLLSLTLANELRDDGVAVVSLDPGDMRTQMHQAAFPEEDISDRPLPEAILPFWAWLLGQPRASVTGNRYQAQSDRWEAAA